MKIPKIFYPINCCEPKEKNLTLYLQETTVRITASGQVPVQSGFFMVHYNFSQKNYIMELTSTKYIQDFEALFKHATIGILAADSRGTIAMVNPFLLSQFGYENENELIGKKIEILIPLHLRSKHISHREGYNRNPQNRPMGVGRDLLGLKKDRTQFPVEISLSHYINNGEQFTFAFITDISFRKESEEKILLLNDQLQKVAAELEERIQERTYELSETIDKLDLQIKETEKAKAQLEESENELRKSLQKEKDLSELKSRFVSIASHEFRTPLSSILSSTYLLSKYTSAEEQPKRDKHIERISSAVNVLTNILNDFLSVGKIEEGKVEVVWKELNLKEQISSLLKDFENIVKKGQSLNYVHRGTEAATLDSSLLKHVLMNLISNAIKYSPEYTAVEVTSIVDDHCVKLRVKDNGIGISKEDQKHLFERFYRASNTGNIQGTGLGLHIVSKYVEMMNGEIICNSEIEKGTEFIVVFQNNKQALL